MYSSYIYDTYIVSVYGVCIISEKMCMYVCMHVSLVVYRYFDVLIVDVLLSDVLMF